MDLSKQKAKIEIFSNRSSENNLDFQGKHLLLELYECNNQKLNDELYLRCLINNSAKAHAVNPVVLDILLHPSFLSS